MTDGDDDKPTKKAEAKKEEAKEEEEKKEEVPKNEEAEVKKAEKDKGEGKKKEEEAAELKKDGAGETKKENDVKPEAVAKKEKDAKPSASASAAAAASTSSAAAPAAEETPKRTKKRKKSQLDVLLDGDISVPTSTKRERKSLASYKPEDFAHPSERSSGEGWTTGAREDLPVPLGRGTKLSDLESVRDSIKKTKTKGPILAAAHKLVFSTRGKAAARNMKPQLLKFYGYLPPVKEDVPKEEWDQIEEDIEAKMSEKAYRLKSTMLKDLCDLFDVDRRAPEGKSLIDKDTLIDRLLNFLGEPKESMTKTTILAEERKAGKGGRATPNKKGGKKKSATPKKKTPVSTGKKKKKAKKREEWEESDEESSEDEPSEDETEDEESDEEEEEAMEADAMDVDGEGEGEGEGGDKGKTKKDGDDQDKASKAKEENGGEKAASASAKKKKPKKKKKQPKLPSDNALRRWVRAYVRCFNLDKATTKHAIETASDKFGVDLTEKKGRIKELLTEEMS